MNLGAIILAAGSGTRLNDGQPSEKPKVLYEILGRPMIAYTLDLLKGLKIDDCVMVVGYKANQVKKIFGDQVKMAVQKERMGTAHAASVGEKSLKSQINRLLIIQGDDSAFYHQETIKKFIEESRGFKIAFTTVKLKEPKGFGRVIRNKAGEVVGIVEKEAATAEQMKIKEVNAATYLIDRQWFVNHYPKLKPSKVGKGEIIMPDLIEIAFKEGERVLGFEVSADEWVGINTAEELKKANRLMKERLA